MLTLSDADRQKIRAVIASAADVKNQISENQMLEAMQSIQKMYALADSKNSGHVLLSSEHVAMYDIIMHDTKPMDHLSISRRSGPVLEEDVLIIATEFGLGDRSTWTLHMPPKPPTITAYHIFRTIKPNA